MDCCNQTKYRVMRFNATTPLPIQIPILFSIGKFPFLDIQQINADDTTTYAPLVVPTYTRDAGGYVTLITLNPAPDPMGALDQDIYVIVHPDFIYK
jgi:hypothetical protein